MIDGSAGSDPSEEMLGAPGFVVLAAGTYAGEPDLLIQLTEAMTGCPRCGVVATAHGRREHAVRDVPSAGLPATLVQRKRIWRCAERTCSQRTWTETSPAIRAAAALIEQARVSACRRVGEDGGTVEDVWLELGVGWATGMRAVRDYGRPLVDDRDRGVRVLGLGVDGTAFLHATAIRSTHFVTGIVDLTPGVPARPLDGVPGQSGGQVYAAWIVEQDQQWYQRIPVGALGLFRGYATALRTGLPHGVPALDAFHVVRVRLQVLDEVRRRVQQKTLEHRGPHKADLLYGARRVLRRG